MTNEQLAVLLREYCVRLVEALVLADASLPEDIERAVHYRYIGKSGMFDFGRFLSMPLEDPDDWSERPGAAVALEPIRAVACDMEQAITCLMGE